MSEIYFWSEEMMTFSEEKNDKKKCHCLLVWDVFFVFCWLFIVSKTLFNDTYMNETWLEIIGLRKDFPMKGMTSTTVQ